MKQKIDYYSPRPALGYNFFMLMCIGMRGRGKSTGWLNFLLDDFLKRRHKFIWMRRYKAEITGKGADEPGCAKDFGSNLKDINGKEVSVNGNNIFLDGKQCGQFMALTTATKAKGRFTPKDYYNIVFDEFLIDNPKYSYIGGYNEPFEFLKACDSILRPTPEHDVGRLILLANSVKFANPYFLYFNVPIMDAGTWFDKESRTLVEFDYSDCFREQREQTSFGKLTKKTSYHTYAFENKFLLDSSEFIAPRPYTAYYECTLIYKGKKLGVWFDRREWNYHIGFTVQDNCPRVYSITSDDMRINTMLASQKLGNGFRNIIDAYKFAQVRFDDIKAQGLANEMLSMFI